MDWCINHILSNILFRDFVAEPYPLIEVPADCEPPNTARGSSGGRHEQPSPIMESGDKNMEQVGESS